MAFFGFGKSNVLYYPGCATFFKHKNVFNDYQKILLKLGIKHRILDKQICCGLPALEAGYETEARKTARKNLDLLKEEGFTKIITNCPVCYRMFSSYYPNFLPDWNIEIIDIYEEILKKINDKPELIKVKLVDSATLHDNTYFSNYGTVRKILDLIGYDIKEFYNNREDSLSCGSEGGVNQTNLDLSEKLAKDKLLSAKRINVDKIIVTSLEDYDALSKYSSGENIQIIELSEILSIALGLKNPEELNKKEEKDAFLEEIDSEIEKVNKEEKIPEVSDE